MNLSITLCLLLLPFQAVHGQGNVILQVLLNNGNSHYCLDRWNNCCEPWEWDFLSRKVYTMSQNQRRGLRGGEEIVNDGNNTDAVMITDGGNSTTTLNANSYVERDLNSWPRFCANNCRGYAAGRCFALNCLGYRRRSVMDTIMSSLSGDSNESGNNDRNLFWATNCENQKSEMNNLLNNNKGQVGPRCRSLLEAPRQMTCFSNVAC